MGKWDYCARGIILDSKHKIIDPKSLEGVDFIINDIGSWGSDLDKDAPQRLSVPYTLNIPSIAKMWIDYLPYQGRGIYNEENWPKGGDEEHLASMDRALYSGGYGMGKRYYHTIMWDMTHTKTVDEKAEFTSSWLAKATDYIMREAYQRYHLPEYAYFTSKLLEGYGESKDQLTNMFAKNANFNPMSCRSYCWTVGDVIVNKFSEIPYPSDNYGPDYLYAPSWGFWQVSNEKFKIKGVTDSNGNLVYVPVVLFNGNKKKLYEATGFTPMQTGPSGPAQSGPTGPSGAKSGPPIPI